MNAIIKLYSGTGSLKSVVEIVGKVGVRHRPSHNGDGAFVYCIAKGSDGRLYETKSNGGGYRLARNQEKARRIYTDKGNQ